MDENLMMRGVSLRETVDAERKKIIIPTQKRYEARLIEAYMGTMRSRRMMSNEPKKRHDTRHTKPRKI
jgi:hypothetical protein